MITAVSDNKPEMVRLLIKHSANVNQYNKEGKYPIHIAAEKGYLEIIHVLLDAGADVNQSEDNDSGDTALINLLRCDSLEAVNLMLKLLIKHSVNVNQCNKEGKYPIHIAAEKGYLEIIRVFLDVGADVNQSEDNDSGDTALIISSRCNRLEAVKLLVAQGASITKPNKINLYPLYFAAARGSIDIIKTLLKTTDTVNQADYQQVQTFLESFVNNSNSSSNKDCFPIHIAAREGKLEILNILLQAGADVNQEEFSESERTPLSYAVVNNQPAIVEQLMRNKAKVSKSSINSMHPIFFAVENGFIEIVEIFLKNGFHVYQKSRYNRDDTILITAIKNNQLAIVRYLLTEAKANINQPNESGLLPLRVMAESTQLSDEDKLNLFKVMIEYRVNLNLKARKDSCTAFSYLLSYSSYTLLESITHFLVLTGKTDFLSIAWNSIEFSLKLNHKFLLDYFPKQYIESSGKGKIQPDRTELIGASISDAKQLISLNASGKKFLAFGIKFSKEALTSHELKDNFLKFHFVNLDQLEKHTFEPDDLIQKIKIIAANLCRYSGKNNQSLVKTLHQAFELLLNKAGLDERLEKKCLFISIAQVLHFAGLTASQRETLLSKYWQYYKHALGKMPSLKLLCLERLLDSNQDKEVCNTGIPKGVMEMLTLTLYKSPSQYSAVGLSKLMRFNTIFKEESVEQLPPVNNDELGERPTKRRKLN